MKATKKQSFRLFVFLLFFFSFSSFSQEVSSESIASEKAKEMKVLMTIARSNNIDYDDLLGANLNTSKWLQENTIDSSFVSDLNQDVPLEKKMTVSINSKKESKTHLVKKNETLYALSKFYKVDIKSIIEANPALSKKVLREGYLLKIPNKRKSNALLLTYNHKVKAKETWYGLSKKYKVTIDRLRALNPKIAKRGLRTGDVLVLKN
ncbi:MAG: LysM peptidoglycan-binding domain-containing protein [Wenyingzhuangia sp.]|jgi:LysM repeat protein|uniref:LysM peptidoglycan-binding domain-containing protein n=1 Tax=Wenyingzhuangia sp. TaxID=1964193 RepID=UPI00321B41C2